MPKASGLRIGIRYASKICNPSADSQSVAAPLAGCRKPPKMLVLDTGSGKRVASLDGFGNTDDLFYDAADKRVLLSGGAGCISVFDQTNSDTYKQVRTIDTPAGSRTSFFVPTSGTCMWPCHVAEHRKPRS
jgi:hypothetical protein